LIRTLLVDDNPYSISSLKKIIVSLNANIEIIGEITDPYLVVPFVKNDQPDLIFMDIDLANNILNGLILIENIIKIYSEIMVIYATAHSEFAHQAWKSDAITLGFIDKPFCKEEIKLCLKKMVKYIEKERISIKDRDNNTHFLNPKDIFMIEKLNSQKDCIIYYLDKKINVIESLINIEEKLKKYNNLVKCYKSFIINSSKISRLIPDGEKSFQVIFQNNFPHTAMITKQKARELNLIS
jgi:DNA-binding LytR/AlgR family response regulator